jgi:carboxyl-terminal processing protease
MMQTKGKKITKFLTIILVITSFFLGLWISNFNNRYLPPEDMDMSLFWESYHKLKNKFVDSDKFINEEIIYGAISGMAASLGDDYTIFLKPEDTKRFNEDVSGSFEGVGMEVGLREGQLQVISPLEGTPAQKAGLIPGDKIIKVDDTQTYDISLDESVNLIRGPRGTEVTLTIYRDEWEETREIKITRGVIDIPSLKLSYLKENGEDSVFDGTIAWLRLYHFTESAMSDFRDAGLDILEQGSRKIILDLRNNPGGYLEVSQYIAGWFLDKGEVVVVEEFGDENMEDIIYKAEGSSVFSDYKIVVLINEGSASASEILAGALRDNSNVELVGQQSFGKGSVQILEKLREGSSLKITVAKWLTPNGYNINGVGLTPDHEVEMTTEDYENGKDPQRDKAIELLKD